MTDDDSESDVNITMTEVVPKLTKKVVEPARGDRSRDLIGRFVSSFINDIFEYCK